ncbi:MAG: hypothetical protein OEV36_09480 [Myxococcales bacterium]|nr:hypothetical protein [Myxococcales bacterium]
MCSHDFGRDVEIDALISETRRLKTGLALSEAVERSRSACIFTQDSGQESVLV